MNTNLGTATLTEFKSYLELWERIKNNPKLQWLRSYKQIPQSPDPITQYGELNEFLRSFRRKIIGFEVFLVLLLWLVGALCMIVVVAHWDAWSDVFSYTTRGNQIRYGFFGFTLIVTVLAFASVLIIENISKMLLDSHLLRLWTTREFFLDVKILAQACGDGPGNPEALQSRDELSNEIAPTHVIKIVKAGLITTAGVILSDASVKGNPDMFEGRKRCFKESFRRFKYFRIFGPGVDINFAYDAAKLAAKQAKPAVQQ